MITPELINRGGSKLEITRLALEANLDIPIPNSSWKYYGESRDKIISDFNKMKKPVIVRGSHKNDYHGFIDVVPTVRYVNSVSGLENAIDEIESTIASEEVKRHSMDWGQEHTDEVHILIQEQQGPIVGSMIRHPHNKKRLNIQYDSIRNIRGKGWPVSFAFQRGNSFAHYCTMHRIPDKQIHKLIRMYEKLENSGILENDWSYQIEFGLNPLFFYQARPFKKFEQGGIFDIPKTFDSKVPSICSSEAFGITSKEGINLDILFAERETVESDNRDFLNKKEAYGLMLHNQLKDTPDIRNNFGNIKFFGSSAPYTDYLFHGNYRLMKKADFSFIECFYRNMDSWPKHMIAKEFKDSRLFSNGLEGVVIPEKYL